MGTIVITEYTTLGGKGAVDGAPVINAQTTVAMTRDATTSTTAENVTLNKDTRFVNIYAVEDHRVAMGSDTTGDSGIFIFCPAAGRTDLAVKGGETLYYRLDA